MEQRLYRSRHLIPMFFGTPFILLAFSLNDSLIKKRSLIKSFVKKNRSFSKNYRFLKVFFPCSVIKTIVVSKSFGKFCGSVKKPIVFQCLSNDFKLFFLKNNHICISLNAPKFIVKEKFCSFLTFFLFTANVKLDMYTVQFEYWFE